MNRQMAHRYDPVEELYCTPGETVLAFVLSLLVILAGLAMFLATAP